MTARVQWAEFVALMWRPATLAVLGGTFVLGFVDSVQVLGRPPLGLAGTLALNTDGTLTYGLAGSALLTALVVSGYNSLADVWHTRGDGLFERLGTALGFVVPLAILTRLVAIAGVEAGGVVDGLRRGWRWGSLVPLPASDLLSGQCRQIVAYLIAGVFGAIVALAARNQIAAVAVVLAATVPYIPFVGALANRIGPALDAFPWAPFGALRGALTGNGGIFGNDPEHIRMVSATPATLALVGWLVVGVAWFFLSGSVRGDKMILMYAVPMPAALAVVVAASLTLPPAMADNVPWRWTPQWRHARDQGQDSRQVAQRWADLTAAKDARASRLFVTGEPSAVDPDIAEVLGAASSVEAEPESDMVSPEYVRLNMTFDPVRRSGNVVIDAAQLQVRLRAVGSGWRISRVEGPFVHVEVAAH